MKTKTLYVSEDNIYFIDKDECLDYENNFYNVLKKAEQENLGERLKHEMFEPCLETKHHSIDSILKMVSVLCSCLYAKAHKSNFESVSKKIEDINRWIDEIHNDSTCDIKQNFTHIKNWLIILRNRSILKYENVEHPFNGHICADYSIFSSIVDRIDNISIVTGIEYPKSKWVYREDEWEEYCKSEKELIANGNKYR